MSAITNLTDKKALYREANETHQVELVRKLNNEGMKPLIPSFSGPTIISPFMDIATKYDIIWHFLKKLRETNKLFTKEEFQRFSTEKWIKKGNLSRILGRDYLLEKITELGLKRIKVPLKVAVFEGTGLLKISGSAYCENLYDFDSDQIKVYAEKITRVDRKLSRDEIDELIKIIAAANFIDLWPQNIVVAEDEIYFIDTEFKSFNDSIDWGKMKNFEPLIDEKDQRYFIERVQEKIDEPRLMKTKNAYDTLTFLVEIYKNSNQPQHKASIEEMKKKISALEYVGAKEVGSNSMRPNVFLLNLLEIL